MGNVAQAERQEGWHSLVMGEEEKKSVNHALFRLSTWWAILESLWSANSPASCHTHAERWADCAAALFQHLQTGAFDKAEALLATGLSVDELSREGWSSLHSACPLGNPSGRPRGGRVRKPPFSLPGEPTPPCRTMLSANPGSWPGNEVITSWWPSLKLPTG